MDKNKIYLDLNKLTKEQIKNLVPMIEGAGDEIGFFSRGRLLQNKVNEDIFLIYSTFKPVWIINNSRSQKQEITYSEFLELFGKTEQLEEKPNEMINGYISILEDNGYFVFPKAEEGDFPDLSDFEGVEMEASRLYEKGIFEKHYIIAKVNSHGVTFINKINFLSAKALFVKDVRPLKQTLTYQELVEKIGLEKVKELAGVSKETEIK